MRPATLILTGQQGHYTAAQWQSAVAAYLKSKQLLLFAIARNFSVRTTR